MEIKDRCNPIHPPPVNPKPKQTAASQQQANHLDHHAPMFFTAFHSPLRVPLCFLQRYSPSVTTMMTECGVFNIGSGGIEHAQVVSITVFVAVLCLCMLIGHLLEEKRWVNESIIAIIIDDSSKAR
ncbi:hypothetical protein Drorol1_Dr00013076 [Drosera rotundifolia]